jgi:hypothetical protein
VGSDLISQQAAGKGGKAIGKEENEHRQRSLIRAQLKISTDIKNQNPERQARDLGPVVIS